MRRLRVVAVLTLVSACAGTLSSTRTRLSETDIAKRASPAIVRIEAGGEKIGTGFILDKTGVVATNLHVVVGESAIKIKLPDGSEYPVTQVDGLDPARDLALLQIQPQPGKDLPTLQLGDSSAMSAGDKVVAIGNPLGIDNTVTNGLLSHVQPLCGTADIAAKKCNHELTVMYISAPISPGSSGGPLFNQFGEVVGVTTAIIPAGQNLNLVVPGNYLKPMIARRGAISLDQFAKETQDADEHRRRDRAGNFKGEVPRHIPNHEITVFDGCKLEDIEDIVNQIGEAIETGAPLYNQGNHEACFRIYEGTAVKFERDAACTGVRSAFGDGLLRASGLNTYTEKAWAMRDTFDGLVDAARRWAEKHPPPAPGARPKKK